MKLLIQSAEIVDPNSPYNKKTKDILIETGTIVKIGEKIKPKSEYRVFNAKGLKISPGWFDMHARLGDPGVEHKEDLESGSKAAVSGGFTGLACMPETNPTIHSKSEVEYIKNKSSGFLVDIYPVGAVTMNREGNDLTEMYDMHEAGAVAFSDANHPISNAFSMLKALLYVKPFNGVILSLPEDTSLSNGGVMNEGATSVNLGLKGIPSLSEESMAMRDIHLAEYTNSRVHFTHVSSAKVIDMIRVAKKKGIKVSASVSSFHLAYDDSYLKDYDTYFKVQPPLRTENDIKALKKGLADGTIDVICSSHSPQDEESKKIEFDFAKFGIINLETSFALANTYLNDKISLDLIIQKIAIMPRTILGLTVPSIKEDEKPILTLFDPKQEWVFEEKNIKSKSRNSPLIGMKLIGKAVAVFNNGKFNMN